jgi:hypothetical protein
MDLVGKKFLYHLRGCGFLLREGGVSLNVVFIMRNLVFQYCLYHVNLPIVIDRILY